MLNNYEVHITVSKTLGIKEACTKYGCKLLNILLDSGDSPHQPMITFNLPNTSFNNMLVILEQYKEYFKSFGIIRLKVEVQHEPDSYIYRERHIKIDDKYSDVVKETVFAHKAHLSRNTNKGSRFITQRGDYDNNLLSTLSELNVPVLKVEDEYVILDTNLSLDEGWLCS